jgi:hypothetical protein
VTVDERSRDAAPTSIFGPELRATSVGLLIVITLIAFEAMAVSAALPTAARAVHGLGAFGWAFTGFLVPTSWAWLSRASSATVSGRACRSPPGWPASSAVW